MGLYAKFDVIDDFHYTRETPYFKIKADYSEGCKVFVETFLRVSTDLVPVDTGYLRSTLAASQLNETTCEAMTDCEYAQYVEYGTWKQYAQPYFEPAYEEALREAKYLWDLEESRIWQEEKKRLAQLAEAAENDEEGVVEMPGKGLMGIMALLGIIFIISLVLVALDDALNSNDNNLSGKVHTGNIEIY